ncbi:MerR family transcriptional regulator [Paraburkholderia phytofirmans OLGA172]|uniref:MerR family transcriptional regulator n=2 Tax=Burkholderiaceae TaxID=119060 RepID=A0A160FRZ8_9BURK|nr:MerR family transcriptional regulator [Paraburkholderia phytofirmans]ANB75612.1 MerR family transcriptional regulator [Paraburkholderia phytofirmans OLGA172]
MPLPLPPPPTPAPDAPPEAPPHEYTIDELARVANSTVRNVRAYQDRGLLAPPKRRGRVGVYDDRHLARLKLINYLLARGYTLANILDLITVFYEGHDLRSILGLGPENDNDGSGEHPDQDPLGELEQMFGDKASLTMLAKAVDLGLLERNGPPSAATSPAALAELLDAVRVVRPHFTAIAKSLVDLVIRQLARYDADPLRPAADTPMLIEAIWRIWPLGMVLVESEMNRALKEVSDAYLADRVAAIFETLSVR